MMKRILLGTDGSHDAMDAATFLGQLPLAPGTQVRVVCVVDSFVEGIAGPTVTERAQAIVEEAAAVVRRPGVEVSWDLRQGDADHQLLLDAEAFAADLIVVGSRGLTGLPDFVLGSVARSVVHHAHCPVLVAQPVRHELRHVLLAHDGSAHAERALEFATNLPLPAPAEVSLVHVVRPLQFVSDISGLTNYHFYEALEAAEAERWAQGETIVRAAADRLEAAGRRSTTEVLEGDPATRILEAAEAREADLIVAGARGTSLIERLVIGSVTDRLLKKAPCSLLIVH